MLDFEVDAWSDHDGQDSKDEIWSRFVEELVIWPKEVSLIKQNSTLGSVVPLAMFEHMQQNPKYQNHEWEKKSYVFYSWFKTIHWEDRL